MVNLNPNLKKPVFYDKSLKTSSETIEIAVQYLHAAVNSAGVLAADMEIGGNLTGGYELKLGSDEGLVRFLGDLQDATGLFKIESNGKLTASMVKPSNLNAGGDITFTDAEGYLANSSLFSYSEVSNKGSINLTGSITASDGFTASNLTQSRVTFAGANGALSDDSNFTWDAQLGLNLGKDIKVGESFNVNSASGEMTAASAVVSDLTDGRITYAGANGSLVDSANFTYKADLNNDMRLSLGASFNVKEVDGEVTAGSAVISDLTNGRVILAGASGALEDSEFLTWDGTDGLSLGKDLKVGSSYTVTASSGNLSIGQLFSVDAASGEASAQTAKVGSLTNTRIVFSDADHKLVDSSNLVWGVDGNGNPQLQITGDMKSTTANIGDITISATTISGLSTPSADNQAANKGYVDSVAQGLDVKQSVRVSAVQAIQDLSNVGQTIDGVAIANGDRVLLLANGADNGIYVASVNPDIGIVSLARAVDMAAGSAAAGAFTFVEEGTNADCGFVVSNNKGSDIVGPDALTWTQFSSAGIIEAGNGLKKTGNVLDVMPGNGLEITTDPNNGQSVVAVKLGELNQTLEFGMGGELLVSGVPAQFKLDGTAVTANATAANLIKLLDGCTDTSSQFADELHAHEQSAAIWACGATIDMGAPVYCNGAQVAASDAASAGNIPSEVIGIAAGSSGNAGSVRIIRDGIARGVLAGKGFGPADKIYLAVGGGLHNDVPSSANGNVRVQFIGYAANSDGNEAKDLVVCLQDYGILMKQQ